MPTLNDFSLSLAVINDGDAIKLKKFTFYDDTNFGEASERERESAKAIHLLAV